MISASSIRNSSMDYHSCEEFDLTSIKQFFITIISLSKLSTHSLQCRRLVNFLFMLKKKFNFNLRIGNPQNLLSHKKKHLEIVFHGTSTKSMAIHNFLTPHVNGEKSPNHFSTTCAKWLQLKSLPQKMELSLTGVASIKPLVVGFRK